jgi:AcrR family transcriptional regulator
MTRAPRLHDHRSRVAAERRARMRRTLVEAALLVFAEKGVDASVIDDVITAAGVSRGTFYNYFRTNAELLIAANEELGNELVRHIEESVASLATPAARLATGIRLYFDMARRFPLLAQFLARVGPQAAGPSNLLYTYLPVHLAGGMKCGEFVATPISAALDIIVGTGVLAVARISAGEADDKYLHACLLGLMRSLGYASGRAEALIANPLPSLVFGQESLLVRSHRRYTDQKRRRRTTTPALTAAAPYIRGKR